MAEQLSDKERIYAAREFFWKICDENRTVVSVDQARRAIKKLAEALPPFTAVKAGDVM